MVTMLTIIEISEKARYQNADDDKIVDDGENVNEEPGPRHDQF